MNFRLQHILYHKIANIYEDIYSNDKCLQENAINTILKWQENDITNLPIAISATADLAIPLVHCKKESYDLSSRNYSIYLYSMALVRFVNLVVESSPNTEDTFFDNQLEDDMGILLNRKKKNFKRQKLQHPLKNRINKVLSSVIDSPFTKKALSINIPEWIIDLRHDATHGQFPSLSSLLLGVNFGLQWLKENYWEPQMQLLSKINYQLTDYSSTGKYICKKLAVLTESVKQKAILLNNIRMKKKSRRPLSKKTIFSKDLILVTSKIKDEMEQIFNPSFSNAKESLSSINITSVISVISHPLYLIFCQIPLLSQDINNEYSFLQKNNVYSKEMSIASTILWKILLKKVQECYAGTILISELVIYTQSLSIHIENMISNCANDTHTYVTNIHCCEKYLKRTSEIIMDSLAYSSNNNADSTNSNNKSLTQIDWDYIMKTLLLHPFSHVWESEYKILIDEVAKLVPRKEPNDITNILSIWYQGDQNDIRSIKSQASEKNLTGPPIFTVKDLDVSFDKLPDQTSLTSSQNRHWQDVPWATELS